MRCGRGRVSPPWYNTGLVAAGTRAGYGDDCLAWREAWLEALKIACATMQVHRIRQAAAEQRDAFATMLELGVPLGIEPTTVEYLERAIAQVELHSGIAWSPLFGTVGHKLDKVKDPVMVGRAAWAAAFLRILSHAGHDAPAMRRAWQWFEAQRGTATARRTAAQRVRDDLAVSREHEARIRKHAERLVADHEALMAARDDAPEIADLLRQIHEGYASSTMSTLLGPYAT